MKDPYLMQCSAVVIFKHSTTVETGALQIMQLVLVTWFWTCDLPDVLGFLDPKHMSGVWVMLHSGTWERETQSESQKQQRSLNSWPQQQDLTWGLASPRVVPPLAQNFFLPEDSRAPFKETHAQAMPERERAAFQLKACVLDTYGRSKGDPCLNMEWSLTQNS